MVESLVHAVALRSMYDNVGGSTRRPRPPAAAAGGADHVWTIEEIVALRDSS